MFLGFVFVLFMLAEACSAIDPGPGYEYDCDPDPTRPGACY